MTYKNLSRRSFLTLSGVAAAGFGLVGCNNGGTGGLNVNSSVESVTLIVPPAAPIEIPAVDPAFAVIWDLGG